MKNWLPQRFYSEGKKNSIGLDILNNSIEHAKKIVQSNRNLVPIFTLNHLSYLTDIPYIYLRNIIIRKKDQTSYRIFYIKKRKNKSQIFINNRQICVPEPSLLRVQKYIHHNILKHIPPHHLCFSYSSGSIYDAASLHCGCRWLIKIDIRSFFESISEISVYRVFRNCGYPSLLSFELARICTRLGARSFPGKKDRWNIYDPKKYKIINNITELGYLPQGAPTSPILSNLVCYQLDCELEYFARKRKLTYSRYADDLSFSTKEIQFNRSDAKEIISLVFNIVKKFGFSPNYTKTTVVPPGAKKIVLGLGVDTEHVKLSNDIKKRIKNHIYFCMNENIGPIKHAKEKKFASVIGFKNHLSGLIAYAIQIENEFGLKMLEEFKKIRWPFD